MSKLGRVKSLYPMHTVKQGMSGVARLYPAGVGLGLSEGKGQRGLGIGNLAALAALVGAMQA